MGSVITTVSIEDIAYFVFEDRTTLFTTIEKKRYMINITLDELEGMLDPKLFIRANR